MAAAAPQYETWVSEESIRELARSVHDPPVLAEERLEAYRKFLELPLEPNPLYRKYGYFSGVDLTGLDARAHGTPVASPETAPRTVTVVHDRAGTRLDVPAELREEGVEVATLEQILAGPEAAAREFARGEEAPTDRLSAFGRATLNRGYRLSVPDRLARPVRVRDLTILSSPHEALSVRRSIRVGAEARLLVSEELLSTESDPGHQRFVSSTSDLDLADHAHAVFLTLHAPDTRAVSIVTRNARLAREANHTWVWAGFGGFRTKARGDSSLLGTGAVLDDLQAFYGVGHQAYDSGVVLRHVGTDTHGQSITRGVFDGEARGMSRGLVRIEKDARKTLSFLSEHAILLSRGARSDTVPVLEILCRDVKATHSSSVAPVDPERIFYLESRGVSRSDAIRLIGEGFLSHVLDRAPVRDLREILYPYLAARWEGRPIVWGAEGVSALPPLEFSESAGNPDWRFDAKLR